MYSVDLLDEELDLLLEALNDMVKRDIQRDQKLYKLALKLQYLRRTQDDPKASDEKGKV